MKLIKLTHANLKTVMYVPAGQIGGFYKSEGHKCTHVVSAGGAVFPASETVEEIKQLLGTMPEGVVADGDAKTE